MYLGAIQTFQKKMKNKILVKIAMQIILKPIKCDIIFVQI